jgi:Gas vesicle synthesis protein GvpO
MSPQSKSSSGGGNRGRSNGTPPAEIARSALRVISELTGRRPENVLGLRKDDDGWIVTLEIVELSRIPPSTDLLGVYAVHLDDDGDLMGYERLRRYLRGQAGGDDQ